MSELFEEDYQSDFAADPYSVLNKSREGQDVVTTVVIDGELMEFTVTAATQKACMALVSRERMI